MVKKVIIDAEFCEEIRVATIQNGSLIGFDHEFINDQRIKGSIYLATVKHVEPSLQAVFIEYEEGKHGFLPFSEISPEYYSIPYDVKAEMIAGLYKNYRNFCLRKFGGSECDSSDKPFRQNNKKLRLKDVIKCGQHIVVQAVKDERGSKCASFSCYVGIAGRSVVFMPNSGMKIPNNKNPEDIPFIPIPFGIGKPDNFHLFLKRNESKEGESFVESDLVYLIDLWDSIKSKASSLSKCSLLYSDFDIIRRTMRDTFGAKISEITVSGASAYKKVSDYFRSTGIKGIKLRRHKDDAPIFHKYGIEEQLLEMYQNKIFLPSGGHLVITPTEAFVSIDVNSGKMTAENNLEDTAYKTNKEAALEIPRQIKIKGLSGLIVIDFIDMLKYKYCRDIENVLRNEFKNDSAKTNIGNICSFGLVAISRQRIGSSVFETSMTNCEHCSGLGKIRTCVSIAMNLIREVRFISSLNKEKEIMVLTMEDVAKELFNNYRKEITKIEDSNKVKIKLESISETNKDFLIKIGGKIQQKNRSKDEMALISEHESFKYEDLLKSNNRFWIYGFFKRLWINQGEK